MVALCLWAFVALLLRVVAAASLSRPFLYPPDGFYFQHKLAPHIGGTNPLALSWRDERIASVSLPSLDLN